MSILIEGSLVFGGKSLFYKVAEVDRNRLNISVSFIMGAIENGVVFKFNNTGHNRWSLDKNDTKSDINIDLNFNKKKRIWSFGTDNLEVAPLENENIQLIYKCKKLKKGISEDDFEEDENKISDEIYESKTLNSAEPQEEIFENNDDKIDEIVWGGGEEDNGVLYLERNGEPILFLNDEDYVSIEEKEDNSIFMTLDLDALADNFADLKSPIGIIVPTILDGLYKDFERTINEKINEDLDSKDNNLLQISKTKNKKFTNRNELLNCKS